MRKKNEFVYPAKELRQYRNKFKMPHTLKTTFNHGLLIPFKVYEVLPGDTFKMNLASLIRMSTPIAPIMDNITMHMAAYFVPSRIIYEHFEEVMGANKTGAWWDDEADYEIPTANIWAKATNGVLNAGSIADYLGIPQEYGQILTEDGTAEINLLPFRAYFEIWNEYYRSEVVSAPEIVYKGESGKILTKNLVGEASQTANRYPLPLGKYPDYFTKALPEPQKGPEVKIPGLDFAWLDTADTGKLFASDNTAKFGYWEDSEYAPYESSAYITTDEDGIGFLDDEEAGPSTFIKGSNLGIKLQEALGNINALRFAFQLQKFFEKDARYGTRFFEMLNGMYGVSNPDLVLQRPQLLGEMNWHINIDQVLSTSGYSASTSTTVGAPGANSVTAGKGGLFTASFTEPGYILIVGGTRHDHTYGQGLNRLWLKKGRLDFYNPLFANIGEQPVYDCEIDLPNLEISKDIKDGIFGYQEAWAEHRMEPDKVTALMNPYRTGSLDFWNLADEFSEMPLLNTDFIYENRTSLQRALVTGSTGPDFIADFYFDLTAVRELPLYSIPGLADHH